MKCVREDLKAHITDVLVNEADPNIKEQLLAHLEACASCREDQAKVEAVLGLLKESPPWLVSASAEGDSLSAIQRQKLSSLATGRAAAPPAAPWKVRRAPMSWLALAASLSTVGLALVLARKGAETPIEAPTPAAVKSSITQLPQAPEGPMLPKPSTSAPAEAVTTPASERRQNRPDVVVSQEALREFHRPIETESEKKLEQAPESNEAQPAKKDKAVRDEAPVRAPAKAGVAGGVVGAAAGGVASAQAPPPPPPPAPASAPAARSDARANASERDRLAALGYVETPAPRDMTFEAKGTNPFIVTEEDPHATFGLDVDTASYTLTRNYLNRGLLPPPAAVRVEEFVNAFSNNVVADRSGDARSAFAVRVDGAPNPLHPGYHIIRVAMKAKDVDPRERKPAHLTFVIDVSGSMAAENRLGLVKRSLALLVDKLDERDRIGIVIYGTTGRRVLPPTSVDNRERILAAIDRLSPEGSTNLQDGLDLGYEMAAEQFAPGSSNRVVLCTDGVANTGQTEADALLARIRGEAKRGIDMMALGFGMGNYNDALLQRLADEGNGQYAYIDDLGEARAFFLRKLTSVLEVVARDAKAQVEFNPARVERYRLLGYEKRDVADRDFRNDAVDAGEINSGHSVTALFEVKLKAGSARLGVARLRYKSGPRSEGVEFEREIVDEAVTRTFGQASPAFRTAYVAARFAEHLRKSYWVKDESLSALVPLVDELPDAPTVSELSDLIRKASRLIRPAVREDW